MKIAIFNSKSYDEQSFLAANQEFNHELVFLEPRLTRKTVALASGYRVICAFVNDQLDAGVLLDLKQRGVEMVALRCAGFNNVDREAAQTLDLKIVRVPAYSPYAVAEHTLALMLTLNRRVVRAMNRVRDGNFSLEGLVGFEMRGKTVGIIGFGKIGRALADVLSGLGCRILVHDTYAIEEEKLSQVEAVSLEQLFHEAHIISLHCPLSPSTHHIINHESLALMQRGSMLINTSRGGLIDTRAVIESLKSGKLGYLGLDVYEEEEGLFFEDLSDTVIQDDTFARLLTFPNVVITSHQAFFTDTALQSIAHTTLENIYTYYTTGELVNAIPLSD